MVPPINEASRLLLGSGLTARSAKRFLTQIFLEGGLPFAEDDALEIILSATGLDKTGLMLRGDEVLTEDVLGLIQQHMQRRISGEPVDHILGWREFFGRRFTISSDVLSPRADTETLIRGALQRLKGISSAKILDLGTGSGAIGLTLLAESPDATLTATDMSDAALGVASQNAEGLNVQSRTQFLQGFWWDAVPLDATFDIILSNPPYITDEAMEALEREVKTYDPDIALRGGADGLDAYREIISGAGNHLAANGWLGFEVGFDQGEALQDLLNTDSWTQISLDQDLGGLDRVVWAQKQA